MSRFWLCVGLVGWVLGAWNNPVPAADPAAPKADPAAQKAAVERYVQFNEAARREILTADRCPYSPAAVLMHVGGDPEALARFVRDQIAYEPYAGALRGAEGTLAAQAGNDWDKALLLRELLAQAGYAAQFRVVPRAPAEAEAIVDGYLAGPAALGRLFAVGEAKNDEAGARLLARFGIPKENAALNAARESAAWKVRVDEAFDAAGVEGPRIRQALGNAALGVAFEQWRAPLLAAAAQRVLVEIKDKGASKLLTVDGGPAPAAEVQAVADLPAEQQGLLTVRLVMSVAGKEQAAAPVVLLDQTRPLHELLRKPLRLEIVPSDAKAAAKSPAAWTPAEWYTFVTGFEKFQALLYTGQEWTGSKVFDLQGNIFSVASDGRIEGSGQMGSSVQKGFGGFGLGGGDDEPAKKPQGQIESLVMELELKLPGQPAQKQQRLICGRLRPGITPLFSADFIALGGPVGAGTVSWLTADTVTRNASLLGQVWSSKDPQRFSAQEQAVRLPTMLHQWQLGRLELARRLLQSQPELSYVGGPVLVLRTTQLRADASSKTVSARPALDLAFDAQRLVPRKAEAAPAAVDANLKLGVAATVLESVLLRSLDPSAPLRGAYAASQHAQAAGVAPLVRPADAQAAAGQLAPLSAWAVERNETGRMLLLAQGQQASSWWSIDPASGGTIGRGDGGEGQSAMEYLQITKMNLSNLKCMLAFQQGFIMGNKSPNQMAGEWLGCVTGADNPGSYVGGIGNLQDVYGVGGGLAAIGDILGGAYDLAQMASGD